MHSFDSVNVNERTARFESCLKQFRKIGADVRIPWWDRKTSAKPYLLTVRGLKGVKLPPNKSGSKLSAELTFTFFYRDTSKKLK